MSNSDSFPKPSSNGPGGIRQPAAAPRVNAPVRPQQSPGSASGPAGQRPAAPGQRPGQEDSQARGEEVDGEEVRSEEDDGEEVDQEDHREEVLSTPPATPSGIGEISHGVGRKHSYSPP